ncbi:MAG: L-rhamnose mutarotase [Planctomycetes bacterium]|nr:L-rhamnose mutarotase [Planctomycetota bacterium]
MERHGLVLRLKPGARAEYERLHAAVWPEVLATITRSGIQNYSIFVKELDDGREHLFAYFEYHGNDFAADMAHMAADPATQRWWSVCAPLQDPIETRASGEWWARMREVFHHD